MIAVHTGFYEELGWIWGLMDLFFVMSGFLITKTMLQNKSKGGGLAEFLVLRLTRLMPVFLVTVVAYELLVFFFFQHKREPLQTWPYLFLVQNIDLNLPWVEFPRVPEMGHFWSLVLEEQFYLFWGICFYTFGLGQLQINLRVVFGAALLVMISMVFRALGCDVWTLPARFEGFMIGSLYGLYVYQSCNVQFSDSQRKTLRTVFDVFCVLSVIRVAYFSVLFVVDHDTYKVRAFDWLDVTSNSLICLWLVRKSMKWEASKIYFPFFKLTLIWLGGISYELYVVHYPIAGFVNRFLGEAFFARSVLWFLFTVVLSIPTAYMANLLLTQPALRNRRRVISYFLRTRNI